MKLKKKDDLSTDLIIIISLLLVSVASFGLYTHICNVYGNCKRVSATVSNISITEYGNVQITYSYKVNGKSYTAHRYKGWSSEYNKSVIGNKKFITINEKKPQEIMTFENINQATLPVRIIFAFAIELLILSIIGCIMDVIRKKKE